MKIFILLSVVVLFLSGFVLECGGSQCQVAPSPKCKILRAAATSRRFAYRLFREVRKTTEEDKNIFFSPLNIGMAITMLLPGSTGKTRDEIITALKWIHTIDKFEKIDLPCLYEFYNEATTIASEGNITLKTANKVFAQEGLPLNEEVKTSLQKYGAPLQEVNFAGDPEESRNTINSWVSNMTEELIPELFKQGDIDSNTIMALTSAIYFKGTWVENFRLAENPEMFIVSPTKSVMAPFMERKGSFKYLERDGHIFFDVPYRANYNGNCLDVSMILISNQKNPFKQPGSVFTDHKMARLISDLNNENSWPAVLRMPKFKISTEYDMIPHMKALGMKRAFNLNEAELMNFIDEESRNRMQNLYVSTIVHKAFVDVNEEGTEAAAATGILVAARSFFIPPVFTFNKPFTFLIYDHSRKAILFMGRITDPTAA